MGSGNRDTIKTWVNFRDGELTDREFNSNWDNQNDVRIISYDLYEQMISPIIIYRYLSYFKNMQFCTFMLCMNMLHVIYYGIFTSVK